MINIEVVMVSPLEDETISCNQQVRRLDVTVRALRGGAVSGIIS